MANLVKILQVFQGHWQGDFYVKEAPIFVTSRLNAFIGNEVFNMLISGVGSVAETDKAE